jgi:hypothetical protein
MESIRLEESQSRHPTSPWEKRAEKGRPMAQKDDRRKMSFRIHLHGSAKFKFMPVSVSND